uniref:Uncharacterized protein n=1 Tax=Romanomermis culicivorax TaxID=13658 RepID=A0A915J602_ROMCU
MNSNGSKDSNVSIKYATKKRRENVYQPQFDEDQATEILDDEVLSCLVRPKYMFFEDLCNFQLVSRKCNFYADKYYKQLKSLDIGNMYGISQSQSDKRVEIARSREVFTNLLEKLAAKCPNLRSLRSIGKLSVEILRDDDRLAPHTYGLLEKNQFELLHNFKKLTSVGFYFCLVDNSSLGKFLNSSPNLTTLEISHYSVICAIEAESVLTAAFRNLRLKKLKFSWGVNLDGRFLASVDTSRLEFLNLEGCNMLAENLEPFLRRCEQLLDLNLTFSACILDSEPPDAYLSRGLIESLEAMKKLHSLTIDNLGYEVDEAILLSILSELTDLKFLKLILCTFITDEFLDVLTRKLKKMENLYVDRRSCSSPKLCQMVRSPSMKRLTIFTCNYLWGDDMSYDHHFHLKAEMLFNKPEVQKIADLYIGPLESTPEKVKEDLVSILKTFGRQANSIDLSIHQDVDFDPFIVIAQYCPFISRLTYRYCENFSVDRFRKIASRLQKLEVCSFDVLCHENPQEIIVCLKLMLDRMKKLRTIYLSHQAVHFLRSHPSYQAIRHKIKITDFLN